MYLWSIQEAKQLLRDEAIDDRKALHYLIAWGVLYSLAVGFDVSVRQMWTGVGCLVVGTLYVYHCNRVNPAGQFLLNYTVLGWVCGLRMALYLFVLLLGLMLVQPAFIEISNSIVSDVIFNVCIYLYIGHHVRSLYEREET